MSPLNNKAKDCEKIIGKVTGGNLICIISTIDTPWQINTTKKILLIEDTLVSGYHLDRLLTHIDNSGLFKNIAAIVFWRSWNRCFKSVETFSEKINVPVYKSNNFDHEKNNLPFGYGFNGVIKKENKNALDMEMTS